MNVPKYRFDPKKIKMVKWFSPGILAQTGVETLLSSLFGKFADSRNLEAFSKKSEEFDYSQEKELWVDYVADLGDGWNSTYSVAKLLSFKNLKLAFGSKEHNTERGRVLIMGGDQVYPSASRDEYLERMVFPYECALPSSAKGEEQHLFAIPGNHDWYDGLQSFQRLFCQKRWIGGRETRQGRSYFYLKLPGNWKVIALDIQFSSDIDHTQKEYFLGIVETLTSKDKVILCIAEPTWLRDAMDSERGERNVEFLERKIVEKTKNPIHLYIAGDLHYYNRYESGDGLKRQKITAGGGGAFLHPTHMPKIEELPKRESDATLFKQKSLFPPKKDSRRLSFRNLLFPLFNPAFCAALGLISLVSGWLLHHDIREFLGETPFHYENLVEVLCFVFGKVFQSLGAMSYTAIIFVALIAFTDPLAKKMRAPIGFIHASAHFFSNMLIGWYLAFNLIPYYELYTGWVVFGGVAALFLLGAIFSGFIFGIYLFLMLNLGGLHITEAMSSIPVEDYKNFVRFHVSSSGRLTIYPVGIARVAKKWSAVETLNENTGNSELTYNPVDKIEYALIEEPIVIEPGR